MSAVPAPQRIELSPAVRAILEVDTPKSQLLKHFLRFSEAILAPDPVGIDKVVTSDARFHELEAIGYPRGPEGFKIFRRQVNAAIPDEHIRITSVRFEGEDIIEADLDISATHTGEEFMGIPTTGRKIRFDVRARGRFVDGKMAEGWDRADFEEQCCTDPAGIDVHCPEQLIPKYRRYHRLIVSPRRLRCYNFIASGRRRKASHGATSREIAPGR